MDKSVIFNLIGEAMTTKNIIFSATTKEEDDSEEEKASILAVSKAYEAIREIRKETVTSDEPEELIHFHVANLLTVLANEGMCLNCFMSTALDSIKEAEKLGLFFEHKDLKGVH